jgi:pyruvate-formate lyase
MKKIKRIVIISKSLHTDLLKISKRSRIEECGIFLGCNEDFKFEIKKIVQDTINQFGTETGDPEKFETWEEFLNARVNQIQFMIKHTAENYNLLEQLRSEFLPTPCVSTIVRECAEKALDVPSGCPELRFITIEGVGYATTVDSLLAIKKVCV